MNVLCMCHVSIFVVGSPREGIKMGLSCMMNGLQCHCRVMLHCRDSDYDANQSEWYEEELAYVKVLGTEELSS